MNTNLGNIMKNFYHQMKFTIEISFRISQQIKYMET